jgi:hypothetical protein
MSWWLVALVAVAVVFLVLVLLELKTSRPDGTLIGTAPYRRALMHITPRRNDSHVFFDTYVDAEPALAYLEAMKARGDVHLTHLLVAACNIALYETPRMNRFVKGHRLYQRKGRWLSFSVKKVKKDRTAKLAAMKMEMNDADTFLDVVRRMNEAIGVERSGSRTAQDKEMDFLAMIPRLIFATAFPLIQLLDYYNLVPGSFIKGDGMYTSMFIANLGSIDMAAAYHHLYEWGNAPLFLVVGRVEEKPWIIDGKVVPRKMIPLRFTFEERIDDGMNAQLGIDTAVHVLEHPFERLGCTAVDGSDTFRLIEKSVVRG